MRYKVVPEPTDWELLIEVGEALPLVPGSVEDCCTRIRDRTALASRDEAREWLTFAQAVGLAVETDRGFHRARETPDEDDLRAAFRSNVFGAREVLDALAAGEPLTTTAAFEAVRDIVPRWERSRHADWESEWQDRTARVLAWSREFGLAERTAEGYVPADR